MPATIFSSASGASVRRISSARAAARRRSRRLCRPRRGSHLQPAASHQLGASPQRVDRTTALDLDHLRGERPANAEPDGDRKPDPVALSVIQAAARRPDAPRRTGPRQRQPVRLDRVDVAIVVDPGERADGGSLNQREAEQRQRGADQRRHQHERTGASPSPPTPAISSLEGVITRTIGISREADPEEQGARPTYIRLAEDRIWPHVGAARRGAGRQASRLPSRRRRSKPEEDGEHDQDGKRISEEPDQPHGRRRPRRRRSRSRPSRARRPSVRRRPVAPLLGRDRLRPLRSLGPVGPLKNASWSSPHRPS